MTMEQLKRGLEGQRYIFDESFLVTLYVALELGRPLLIEGAAGVGKTQVAKALAGALGNELVRLQCYEGIDEGKALYEWNYQKQLLAIQLAAAAGSSAGGELFSREYLLERPLLKSIQSPEPVVLLIDEIDKSDEEFEAFLLELLSDFQVSIPELGTIRAVTRPIVVLTSNNTRPLSDALRRRCAYMYLDYPTVEREIQIIKAHMPLAEERLAAEAAAAVRALRRHSRIIKKPSVAETLDWVAALTALGEKTVTPLSAQNTLGFVLKSRDDLEVVSEVGFQRILEQDS